MITEDGYILELHRITGSPRSPSRDGKKVAFLMHGLLDSSATWVMTGTTHGLGLFLIESVIAKTDCWLILFHKRLSTRWCRLWRVAWKCKGKRMFTLLLYNRCLIMLNKQHFPFLRFRDIPVITRNTNRSARALIENIFGRSHGMKSASMIYRCRLITCSVKQSEIPFNS